MFTSKLATTKDYLSESIRGLIRGYCLARYQKTDFDEIFMDEKLGTDQFLYHLGEESMTLDQKDCTMVDFQEDFQALFRELHEGKNHESFRQVCDEELLQGEDIHLPFPDFILSIGSVALQFNDAYLNQYPAMHNILVRVTDVTPEWNSEGDFGLGRQHAQEHHEQREKYRRVVQISMYGLMKQTDAPLSPMKEAFGNVSLTLENILVPLARPLQIFITEDGRRFQQSAGFYNHFVENFMYPSQSQDSIKEWEKVFMSLALYVLGSFAFLYKHQRIDYIEIEPPEGLQKKRRKRNLKPYERYCVSRLGNFTKTVSTGGPSLKEEDAAHGVALHIRRGHWKLNYGHSRLPVDQQKKHWQAAMVVGNPEFGIIVRDYESHLLEDVG
ncbi:MAG: hypothetical protein RTU92_08545 [Candidatus Thorarchaeota archaeon]